MWHNAGEETEANTFAAELLMPEFLLTPPGKEVKMLRGNGNINRKDPL
jgi:Zn-dependent peptidase ImmA (M78 family)